MVDIKNLRNEIDSIDTEMKKLFKRRLEIAKQIGEYKKERDIPIFDAEREKEIIKRLTAHEDDITSPFIHRFFNCLIAICRDIQNDIQKKY